MRSRKSINATQAGRTRLGVLPVAALPAEWLEGGAWRLPSGQALSEFALRSGFLAPLLLDRTRVELPQAGDPQQAPAGLEEAK